jgi:hypothetical protein
MHFRNLSIASVVSLLVLQGCDKPEPPAASAPSAQVAASSPSEAASSVGATTQMAASTNTLLAQPISANAWAAATPRYEATASAGADFSRAGLPSFISGVAGLSGSEEKGRWSDANVAPLVLIELNDALPKKFELEISASAVGENLVKPSLVIVDGVQQTVLFGSEVGQKTLVFNTDHPVKEIRIIPAAPVSPQSLGWSNDPRKLGILLKDIKIHAL